MDESISMETRELTEEEIKQLHDEPWAIFRRELLYWHPINND